MPFFFSMHDNRWEAEKQDEEKDTEDKIKTEDKTKMEEKTKTEKTKEKEGETAKAPPPQKVFRLNPRNDNHTTVKFKYPNIYSLHPLSSSLAQK